jgi:hypothetical protein
VEAELQNKQVLVRLQGTGNIELERWAVEQTSADFAAAYGVALVVDGKKRGVR